MESHDKKNISLTDAAMSSLSCHFYQGLIDIHNIRFESAGISAIVISYFVNMHTHILLPVLGSIIWAGQIFGHVVPRSVENMNGDYLISNPNLQSDNTFSTRFSDRPDVEYFDLYTPEISTRYDRYSKLTLN